MSEWGNPLRVILEYLAMKFISCIRRERGEVKPLSNHRKRERLFIPLVVANETGRAQTNIV